MTWEIQGSCLLHCSLGGRLKQGLVVPGLNPSTWKAEAGRSLSLRPAWSRVSFRTTRATQRNPVLKHLKKKKVWVCVHNLKWINNSMRPFISLRQHFPLNLKPVFFHPKWLAINPQGSPCLCCYDAVIAGILSARLLSGCWWSKLRSPCLCSKCYTCWATSPTFHSLSCEAASYADSIKIVELTVQGPREVLTHCAQIAGLSHLLSTHHLWINHKSVFFFLIQVLFFLFIRYFLHLHFKCYPLS
jgi:hypothetical protein